MKRFILAQNIDRYAELLALEPDPRVRDTLYELLAGARRELASLVAATSGVRQGLAPRGSYGDRIGALRRQFRDSLEGSAHPLLLIEPGPGLHIVDINTACAVATLADRNVIAGQKTFDAFPDNPANPHADSVANLFAVMKAAAETGRPHEVTSQRYDVRDTDGRFVPKVWRSRTLPVFDDEGRLAYLLNHVEDLARSRAAETGPRGRAGRRRTVKARAA